MAFPVIKIDSTDGAASDSACSGAGPATAVTGTCHNNNGVDGAVLTVSGSLAGVAIDGSHAIYVETPSGRRFARITNVVGSQVTTANAFPAIPSGTPVNYAIGGVRATLAGTNSRLLMEQAASAAGDASAGWTIEMQSGHTETIASTVNIRVASSFTDGYLTISAPSNAATRPVVTFSNNGSGFSLFASPVRFQYFDLENSNATKTASSAIFNDTAYALNSVNWLLGMKIASASNNFWRAISGSQEQHFLIVGSEIAYCAEDGININGAVDHSSVRLVGSYVHDCTGNGVFLDSGNTVYSSVWYRSVVADNGGYGFLGSGSADSVAYGMGVKFVQCVFDGNTSAGVAFSVQRSSTHSQFINCIFSNNGTYGVQFPSASTTVGYLQNADQWIIGCNFYNNTTAPTSISGFESSILAIGCTSLNPSYVNAAAGNYAVGNATLLSSGYPAGDIFGSTTQAFPSVGAAQSAGGSTFMPTYRRRSSPQLRM